MIIANNILYTRDDLRALSQAALKEEALRLRHRLAAAHEAVDTGAVEAIVNAQRDIDCEIDDRERIYGDN